MSHPVFHQPLGDAALKQLFTEARTHNGWLDRAVSDETLRRLADLMKMGPTAANSSPARIVFVKSKEAKEKLKPCMAPGNVDKTMAAPVTAVVGMDIEFYEQLPELFPHTDARSWFAGNDALAETTAMRNSSLQGAYFIMAARALGLDTGPMSGFDNAGVDAAFFGGTNVKSNFISTLGYGDPATIFERSPRPAFDRFNSIV